MDVYRPRGITALAIILIMLAVLGFITGIVIGIEILKSYHNSMYINILFALLAFHTPSMLLGPSFLYYLSFAYINQSNINGLWFRFSAVLIYSGIYLISSVGLLYMKKWGYYLTLIIGILNITGGLFTLLLGIIPLIFGIAIVLYLLSDIKYEFTE